MKLIMKFYSVFVTLFLGFVIVMAWVTTPPVTLGAVILAVAITLGCVTICGLYLWVAFSKIDLDGGV